MSIPLVKYVLTAALRDRLIFSMLILLALGTSFSIFLGSAAATEKDQFSLVFASGGLRILGVMGLVLFVVFFIRRSFESKDVEFLLSRPIGRVQFIVSYAVALSILAIIMGGATGGSLALLAPHLFTEAYILWSLSIIVENIIMVNIALFFSMVLTSAATATLSTLAFYILARTMGQILGILDFGFGFPDSNVLEYIMQGISAVTPRLDLMGQTSWLVYGFDAETVGFGFVVLQGLVFSFLIILASLIDLIRRQF